MLKDFLSISEGFFTATITTITTSNNSIITTITTSNNSIITTITTSNNSIITTTTARLLLFISISPASHSLNITIIKPLSDALRARRSDDLARVDNFIDSETKAPLRGLWCG